MSLSEFEDIDILSIESFSEESLNNENILNKNFIDENFNDQSYIDESFSSESFSDQSYTDENFSDDSSISSSIIEFVNNPQKEDSLFEYNQIEKEIRYLLFYYNYENEYMKLLEEKEENYKKYNHQKFTQVIDTMFNIKKNKLHKNYIKVFKEI